MTSRDPRLDPPAPPAVDISSEAVAAMIARLLEAYSRKPAKALPDAADMLEVLAADRDRLVKERDASVWAELRAHDLRADVQIERDFAHASVERAVAAIQKAAMLMGSTDEWTDQESMIADFQQRLDALIADRADAHTQKEGWYARATRRQRELNEANATIARLSAQVAAARGALEPFAAFAAKAEAFVESRAGASNDASGIMAPTKDFRLSDFVRARAVLAKLSEGM